MWEDACHIPQCSVYTWIRNQSVILKTDEAGCFWKVLDAEGILMSPPKLGLGAGRTRHPYPPFP